MRKQVNNEYLKPIDEKESVVSNFTKRDSKN